MANELPSGLKARLIARTGLDDSERLMDLPEPGAQVPANRPPEFLGVVRSGLEGLDHPEQAPVGVALLSQGESLSRASDPLRAARDCRVRRWPVASAFCNCDWLARDSLPARSPEVRRRHHRADRHRDQQRREHSAQHRDHRIAPGPPPVSLRGADLPGLDRLVGQESPKVLGHRLGRLVPRLGVLLDRLQDDRLQVPRDPSVDAIAAASAPRS